MEAGGMYIAGTAVPVTGRGFVSFALCPLLAAGPTCTSCKYGKKSDDQRGLTADPTGVGRRTICISGRPPSKLWTMREASWLDP